MKDMVDKVNEFFNREPSFQGWGSRRFLNEADLHNYENNGMVNLYHFSSNINDDTAVLDPGAFLTSRRHSYSRKDYEASGFPRVWFYTDPTQKESFFTNNVPLFTTTVPISDIYDLKTDPEGFIAKSRSPFRIGPDFDKLFELIKESYKGAYYSQKNFDNVVWFYPIKVNRET